jgi:hypothetical protein
VYISRNATSYSFEELFLHFGGHTIPCIMKLDRTIEEETVFSTAFFHFAVQAINFTQAFPSSGKLISEELGEHLRHNHRLNNYPTIDIPSSIVSGVSIRKVMTI